MALMEITKKVKTSDDVDWKRVLSTYDDDSNGLMDSSEFVFLVKDLMALRDNSASIALEDAATTARRIASMHDFFVDGRDIGAEQLSKAASKGAFDSEQFLPSMFFTLYDDQIVDEEIPIPLLKATASSSYDSTKEEQQTRPIVAQALKNSLQRSQVRQENPQRIEKVHSDSSCHICFDGFPLTELWGGPIFKKDCGCNIHICLSCLRNSARTQMLQGQRLTCPNMLSINPPRRCTVALNDAFVALLFKASCPLCLNSTAPLVSCGCLLDLFHTFCVPCLKAHISASLASSACLPRCPRYAECRYDMEEGAIRRVMAMEHDELEAKSDGGNEFNSDLEEALDKWHSLRIMRLQSSWR